MKTSAAVLRYGERITSGRYLCLLPLLVGVCCGVSVGSGQATGGVKPCQRETGKLGGLRHALAPGSFDQGHNQAVSQSQNTGDAPSKYDQNPRLVVWWLWWLVMTSKHADFLIETGACSFSADTI